jgi:peptidoglycan-associated lipoprotein
MSRFTMLLTALAVGIGCSHAQTPAPAAPPAAPAAATTAPPAASDANQGAVAEGSSDGAVYFDFDAATLRDDARPVLARAAEELKKNPKARVRIEGNCDERGTDEYNLALGSQRAESAKRYLESLGVAATRIETVSFGSERPKAGGHDESAWSKNRRDDLVLR